MKKKEAKEIVGGLSGPSKMACPGFGLEAIATCPVGAKLALVPGSTCASCYARKGRYVFPTVKAAHRRRKARVSWALENETNRETYIAAWARLLLTEQYFRFHDSGDVFSAEYGELILDIARACPGTRFWIPTREPKFWARAGLENLPNLVVRLSGHMIDGPSREYGLTSTVATASPLNSFVCPATSGKVKDCNGCGRVCWSRNVQSVTYLKH